ncbi:hypothetical protein AX769_07595 [Frondihabitans sp. PAMC 28766]|uniref:DUF2000 domain-containing protein n=1 Tax=Frondihabitans sp. PAMC 28766 TaxID=1795630 RepID=UPI00078BE4CD|nr:DUF2000 domain-containing protein [Frondihabitans sp. PAMC 28766]AMM20054.1 hypothetical protein AX769_07595 [Frondihabitans sp. PAMC 28766]
MITPDTRPTTVGFDSDEIDTSAPTRAARLKWVIAVDSSLPPGRAVNAAICAAASTGLSVPGLLGPEVVDGAGSSHPGLPWAGCSILGGTTEQLAALRLKAVAGDTVFVADMPVPAQHTLVYDEYRSQVESSPDLAYYAVSIVGPKNRVDKLTKGLTLLP